MVSLTKSHPQTPIEQTKEANVPSPSLPRLTLLPHLIKDAISIFVVIMAVHISMAKLLAKTYKYTIDAKQAIWVVAFVATSCIDVMDGLTIAVVFALLTTVFRQQWPSWQILARLRGTTEYRDIKRYQEVNFIEDVCVVRFDAPLLFTNVERFREMIDTVTSEWIRVDHDSQSSESSYITLTDQKAPAHHLPSKFLIIDCSGIVYIDVMGVNCLKEVYEDLLEKSIHVSFASAKAAVRELFANSGLHSVVSKDNFFPTINDAVFFIKHHR
ncbi:hypothetical protein KIN20_006534 [Parelaphostrongylus tenuis]|uniref:STAS domain-containing protein n=1 Tax=Parelaphostrongylus tenuis TaxID=148309 RepID=A0AAD5MKH5_PARTN|nr:hypothetical protein KIN20_006534 [Parelaphostrongylus tenuis]